MKIKEFIEKLREFDEELNVVATEEDQIFDAINPFLAHVYLDKEWNLQFDNFDKVKDYKSVIVIA